MNKGYKFRSPCGIEFTTCNVEGEVLVAREKKNLNVHGGAILVERIEANAYSPTQEEIDVYNLFSKSEKCATCTICTIKDVPRHLGRPGGNFRDSFDVIDTMCVAKMISHPWPLTCPITGDPFSRMGYNMTDEDISEGYVPLYLNAERNELHNIPALFADDNEITFRYRIAVSLDEEDVIEWESCISHHVPNGHKIILNKFDEILNKHKDNPDVMVAVTELRNMFSGMKVNQDD